jgi:hypothetical protein
MIIEALMVLFGFFIIVLPFVSLFLALVAHLGSRRGCRDLYLTVSAWIAICSSLVIPIFATINFNSDTYFPPIRGDMLVLVWYGLEVCIFGSSVSAFALATKSLSRLRKNKQTAVPPQSDTATEHPPDLPR